MRVDVALATFNGAQFLPALLDSLEAQSSVALRVVVSDDGSTDETMGLLCTRREAIPVMIASVRPRANILRNFENALAETSAPYVALSDQDDVWHPNKLEYVLERIGTLEEEHGKNTPILVFCDLQIVDKDLKTISESFFTSTLKSSRANKFPDYVLNNHVPGCAMVMNRALLDLAMPFPAVDIHDHWLITVATLFGEVAFVERSLLKYRQHGSNSIGLGSAGQSGDDRLRALLTGMPRQVARRLGRWQRQAASVRRMMTALKDRYDDRLGSRQRLLIEAVLAGRVRDMHRELRSATTGERTVDYWGILGALAVAARRA